MIDALREFGGLSIEQIWEKLLFFGADGVAIFHGVRGGVIVQLQREFAPFLVKVHYSSHKTNLAMHVISKTAIVSKAKALLSPLHMYFSKSPKKFLEFAKLAKIMETKGLKNLKHYKTLWVGMLAPLKCIFSKWRSLIVKMALDYSSHPPTCALYNLLSNIKSLFGMACTFLLFEVVQSLSKFG